MALNQIGEIASGVVEYDFDYITGVSEKSAMLTTTSPASVRRAPCLPLRLGASVAHWANLIY